MLFAEINQNNRIRRKAAVTHVCDNLLYEKGDIVAGYTEKMDWFDAREIGYFFWNKYSWILIFKS